MSREEWTSAFSSAYDDLHERLVHGEPVAINDYAATDPAEFFAVTSEVYFEQPEILQQTYPAVYSCLHQFYQGEKGSEPFL